MTRVLIRQRHLGSVAVCAQRLGILSDHSSPRASVCLRSEMALLVLFACVCLASAAPQQQAARSIDIDLSVVDDKAQAVPQARIEIRAQGQLLATVLTDAAGRATATLQGRGSLQLIVSKQGYFATNSALEIKRSEEHTSEL